MKFSKNVIGGNRMNYEIKKEGNFSYPCSKHETPRTFDWCEENCENYYHCDTVAWAADDLKAHKQSSEIMRMASIRKCRCGNDRFAARQLARHDIIVNALGGYIEDKGAYDAEQPYGPFTCTVCDTVYEELEELERINEKPVPESNTDIQKIFDIIDLALAIAGFKVLDGEQDSIIFRHAPSDTDYEVKVSEIPG
jgi:hypothetical protein